MNPQGGYHYTVHLRSPDGLRVVYGGTWDVPSQAFDAALVWAARHLGEDVFDVVEAETVISDPEAGPFNGFSRSQRVTAAQLNRVASMVTH